ncbi:MAG: PSD1 domain-containing protein [Zavarzinella sp.]|nr:PSD1 domain-containing protein [Zavarzinella sp.]
MRHFLPLLAVCVVTGVAFAQAPVEKDHAEKMARGTAIFKQHVRPVLVGQCLKCHGGEKTEAELDLTDRDRLLKGGEHGHALVPGDPKKSLLYLMVAHEKKPAMPYKEAKLSDETVRQFAAWIENGAPFDAPLVVRKDAAAWTEKKVPPDARQHWAFQPLRRAAPPPVVDTAWVKTDVDRFILSRLEEKGLTPNPAASKRAIIRRVYFDLIGVPPTPDEVEAFERDSSPDALAKVVDHLLASPHYGERWARHWLDLARFAESHGFEHDYDRPGAYHYRDFVIKALNAGIPYDQFVRWQLAGDELAPNDPLALMATGFLAAGVHSTQITKNEVEKHRYDELDDMLATTGTAMLGLTVGCARCHDHKYDAIPQADYYRMLATFTTTVRSEASIDVDPDGYRKAKATFDAEHAPLVQALADYEAKELPARFAEWEKDQAGKPVPPAWVIPSIAAMKSANGSTLTKKDDGSVLVGGPNPPRELLAFTLETELKGITGLRLEALTDPSLVKNGPGRAANGNFCLTHLTVTAAPKGGKGGEVKLKNPRSTFDQKGLGIAGAIDGDPIKTGWAVDPQIGFDHAASFEFESPVGNGGPTKITVVMHFNNNVGHGIGRPRIALTNSPDPLPLATPAVAEAGQKALETPPEKRTAEQKALLLARYKVLDPGWQKLDKRVKEHLATAPKPALVKALISSEGVPPVRLHTQGEDVFKETYFLRRGDPGQKEAVAPPGYLQVLYDGPDRWKKEPPKDSKLSYRRSAFAAWITDPEHGAGHLLARVIVNRLWQHHLGRGIVATPSDFGVRGAAPTRPELLDFLASELIRNGWRLKPIHRMIVLSATYQQSSRIVDLRLPIADSKTNRQSLDPENTLLWRRPVRRLEAEAIRDSLLAVSGQLDATMYGPGTLDEASRRRSIYFTMKRSHLIPMLVIFDAPDGTVGVGERPATTVAPQALALMNNPQVRSWTRAFARRIRAAGGSPEQVVRNAYRMALSRDATPTELADGIDFLTSQERSYEGKADARELAAADFCQVVLCLNEFAYPE